MASILNNIGSLQNNRQIGNTNNQLNQVLNRLSTGSRINRAFEDAAGLQISNNLRADVRILGTARQNANTGVNIANIADGSLSQASDLLARAGEIAIQAASGTTSDSGREALDAEFQEILGQLDSIGANTNFDGQSVFGGNFNVRVGEDAAQSVDVNVDNLSSSDVGLGGASLLSAGGADAALSAISGAVETVSASRGKIGAAQSRLQSTIDSLSVQQENIQAAESQIRDADVANEVVNLTKLQILSRSGASAGAQSNLAAQNVLSLLG